MQHARAPSRRCLQDMNLQESRKPFRRSGGGAHVLACSATRAVQRGAQISSQRACSVQARESDRRCRVPQCGGGTVKHGGADQPLRSTAVDGSCNRQARSRCDLTIWTAVPSQLAPVHGWAPLMFALLGVTTELPIGSPSHPIRFPKPRVYCVALPCDCVWAAFEGEVSVCWCAGLTPSAP